MTHAADPLDRAVVEAERSRPLVNRDGASLRALTSAYRRRLAEMISFYTKRRLLVIDEPIWLASCLREVGYATSSTFATTKATFSLLPTSVTY